MSDYIELNHPLAESKIKTIIKQIARGLNYLDNHFTVPRDIKPHNIAFGVLKIT